MGTAATAAAAKPGRLDGPRNAHSRSLTAGGRTTLTTCGDSSVRVMLYRDYIPSACKSSLQPETVSQGEVGSTAEQRQRLRGQRTLDGVE